MSSGATTLHERCSQSQDDGEVSGARSLEEEGQEDDRDVMVVVCAERERERERERELGGYPTERTQV